MPVLKERAHLPVIVDPITRPAGWIPAGRIVLGPFAVRIGVVVGMGAGRGGP